MIFTINPTYTTEKFLLQAQEFFNTENYIQLQHFFDSSIDTFCSKLLENPKYFYNNSHPLTHNYHSLQLKNCDIEILNGLEFFKSKLFEHYIKQLIGFELELKNISISRFEHKNYELLHDSKLTTSLDIDVYLFLCVDEFTPEMGGYKVYTTFDEEILYLNIIHNTLTCIFKDEELRQYTKYINTLAKDKKYIEIKLSYEINEEDELL